MADKWRLINEATATEDDDLIGGKIIDAVNRFAQKAEVEVIDFDGTKPEQYVKGTPVRLDVRPDPSSPWVERWGGFVTGSTRKDNTTTLSIYSHDLWLRRREVLKDYDEVSIETILNDLITDLTPLTWDASNIEIHNNKTISRRWKGEKLNEVIDELASISGDEVFGASKDGVFFFKPRDTSSAPLDLTDDNVFESDFDNEGKRDVNQVDVYFGQDPDTGAVTVADYEAQQDLADRLGRPRPIVISTSVSYPEITFDSSVDGSKEKAEEAARRKGQKILNGKSGLLKGRVTFFGGFEMYAGDVVYVNIDDKNVEGDFRVAEVKYDIASGKTEAKLAKNTEGVIDTLVNMSEEVRRVDLRAADGDVTKTKYVSTNNPLTVEVSVEAFKITIGDDAMIWGYKKGGWGHPDAGGGYWGDQRDPPEKIL